MTQPSDVVLAGSKSFLAALLAPLTQRVGVRPRVAGDPQQAKTLCQDPIRLLVFEYQGEQWLPLCRELSESAGDAPVIVAALSPEQTAVQPVLAAVGVGESPIWRGNAEDLLEAVDRALAAESEMAATDAPAIEEDVPIDDIPVDEEVPPDCHLDSELFGASPAPPSVVTPAGQPPVLTRQSTGESSTAAPPVLSHPAVDEPISETPPAEPPPIAPPQVEVAPAAPAVFVSSETWPGTVLPAEDAEFLLVSAVGGSLPRAPALREVTQKVVEALTLLDRSALQGGSVPIDPAILRRASVLRWQVAAALASVPESGSQVDSAAVAALLAGIDGVLADLQKAGEGAQPDVLAALDLLRGALVKEAIDFTDAVHRVTPDAEKPVLTPRIAARPAPVARSVTVYTPSKGIDRSSRLPWGLLIILAVVVALAGTYHIRRMARGGVPSIIAPTLPGGPANLIVAADKGDRKILISSDGKPPDPTELERFRQQEQLKGNVVEEIGPSTYAVSPVRNQAAGKTGGSGP